MIRQTQHIIDSAQAVIEVEDIALQGLYEPPPVAFTFETVGWSVLVGLIVLILVIVIFFQIRKYIHNRYRREAIQEIEALDLDQTPLRTSLMIIKRVAIQVFGREQVGALHGRVWLEFLEKSAKGVQFARYEADIQLALYADQPVDETTQQEIISNAKKWILTHA
ncbi:DUF4381 domain-containing protein [Reichenbachiella carrageenanivorans]|uniref:DUF4381 domain-containing protein n=1 Tax=Reichenbachiella carrageenanivorans TaxID=2979869 RepID=A0ABY6CXY0_9BACT|nr:DUF4381 domain-containing protein [Reichenbachiella carrageenanivorans]UXX78777.1 DUF4381 domain-containing protein [Reichenbachiella carrageenanivorans]